MGLSSENKPTIRRPKRLLLATQRRFRCAAQSGNAPVRVVLFKPAEGDLNSATERVSCLNRFRFAIDKRWDFASEFFEKPLQRGWAGADLVQCIFHRVVVLSQHWAFIADASLYLS